MKKVVLSLMAFGLTCCAALADGGPVSTEITTPTEVGTTSMPAGNYIVTEQSSGKNYALMVSSKGTMILSPAPSGATAKIPPASSPAAAVPAATPAQQEAAGLKSLMGKGLEKGALQLLESGASKQIKNFIPK